MANSDWNAAVDAYMAEERDRLGGPPTPEAVVAYMQGELSESDAARIRALLVYYPELTDVAPAPVAKRSPSRRYLPIAAALLVALLIGVFATEDDPVGPRHVVQPLRVRSVDIAAHAQELPAEPKSQLALAIGGGKHDDYRVVVLDGRGNTLHTIDDVRRADDAVEVVVKLKPGVYRLDVYGDDQRLDSYAVRVTR